MVFSTQLREQLNKYLLYACHVSGTGLAMRDNLVQTCSLSMRRSQFNWEKGNKNSQLHYNIINAVTESWARLIYPVRV